MSADNGVYIGTFPSTDGKEEHRVIHAQAIENVEDETYVRNYFEDAPTFSSMEDALAHANVLADEILKDDFCPILEYGICILPKFAKPLVDYPLVKGDNDTHL